MKLNLKYLSIGFLLIVFISSITNKQRVKPINLEGLVIEDRLIVYPRPAFNSNKEEIKIIKTIQEKDKSSVVLVEYPSNPGYPIVLTINNKDLEKGLGPSLSFITSLSIEELTRNSNKSIGEDLLQHGQTLSWNGCNSNCQQNVEANIKYSLTGVEDKNPYEEEKGRLRYQLKAKYNLSQSKELSSSNARTECLAYIGGAFKIDIHGMKTIIMLVNHDGEGLEIGKNYKVTYLEDRLELVTVDSNERLCSNESSFPLDSILVFIMVMIPSGYLLIRVWEVINY